MRLAISCLLFGCTTQLFANTPIPNANWDGCYVEDYADPAASLYVLPYAVGMSYTVSNGNCGWLTTHQRDCFIGTFACGTDSRYAYDFEMPIGTGIHAARAGQVVDVREATASDRGNPPNVVDVLHADGTLARYLLLAMDGALVQIGDQVAQGQAIALSGNSGRESGGPHLHFEVFDTDGTTSVPIVFRNAIPQSAPLIEDETYTAGSISGPAPTLAAAVLPASRSVQVSATATAFASLINIGSEPAVGCQIAPADAIAAVFGFRATDSANNPVAPQDTPVDVAAAATQDFIISLTPSEPIAPTELALDFSCDGTGSASSTPGLNTLLFSADASPVPDIIGLTTVVDLVAPVGETTLFAVGSANVGITGDVTVSLDDAGRGLPVALNICRTDVTGACAEPPGATSFVNYPGDGTVAFAVFVEPTAAIANDPANNRIFIRFTDGSDVVRGATSTAVRTD